MFFEIVSDVVLTELWIAFVIASIVLLVFPGPTVLTLINYSINQGSRASLPLIFAVSLGDATALALSLYGLGSLLAQSATWFIVAKWIGGVYLIYLGLTFIRQRNSEADFNIETNIDTASADLNVKNINTTSMRRAFFNTYLITALNPKGIMFFIAFLPQFINPAGNATTQLWVLAITFVVLATMSAAMYVAIAHGARQVFSSTKARNYLGLSSGSLLIVAGMWSLSAKRMN